MQTWTVRVGESKQTETIYAVMLWDDIVRADMDRSLFISALFNAFALLRVVANGTFFRIFKASWKCGCLILYPFVMTLLLAGVVLLLAALSYRVLTTAFGWPSWISLALGAAAGFATLHRMMPWLERAFLWQLMNDWVFNWQHANGRRPDYTARLEAFTDHIQSQISGAEIDEILLVGHSTGALTAAEVAARLLARDKQLGRDGPALSLLTLGSSLPIVAMQPGAHPIRAEIESLVASNSLVWADYQAPQDWMNFPGFNPSRDLHLRVSQAEAANPVIRSAEFRRIMSPQVYRRVNTSPFKTHFQFLMANHTPGIYDVFALTLGPLCLRDRVLDENASTLGNSYSIQGYIDEVSHTSIRGWGYDSSAGSSGIEIGIFVNDCPAQIAVADQFRQDLMTARIGNSHHGFECKFDPPLSTAEDQNILVRRLADNFVIGAVVLRATG
ncbi:alpha/beta hydrolase [Methylobacterium sp. yr668]|uniref:alpha/beta hydrolase n=1 Tax=Methylobacterium sp. yr668 TaxID=1761801 RepID=UPI001587B23C|nr:alpha/beta hydrolase [Methylobacterium sp. yr668]